MFLYSLFIAICGIEAVEFVKPNIPLSRRTLKSLSTLLKARSPLADRVAVNT